MQRLVSWMFLAVMTIGVALGPVGVLEAATVRGQPVDMEAVDAAGATVYQQQRFGIGRIAAMLVGGVGVLAVVGGYVMPGIVTAMGGFGSAFVPSGISSAFDAAPAATGVLAQVVPTLQIIQGFVGDRIVHDPMFYVCFAVALLVGAYAKRQASKQAETSAGMPAFA